MSSFVISHPTSSLGYGVPRAKLEAHLATLPERVQTIFREKIQELNLDIDVYYISRERTEDEFPGRKETRTFYTLAPATDSMLCDEASPLYTRVEGEEVLIEEIPEAPVESPPSFCSFFSDLVSKVMELIRSLFRFFFG